ncbi:DUF1206 domain-containing protein [Agrococcus sediminis]|uniref:DUF1206 domain-containing protein n=1 Tax=Agrococcus TaxID=46352 RepID=UPI001FF5D079|nr:DUF1206 domain-containing protein [Agrococcus sp. SCSIO52902]UOW01557.1 DUF1206 domain-containing protein [Agrococcus sp. SCSIO52902]
MADGERSRAALSEAADAAGRAARKAQRAAAQAEEHRATSWVEAVGQSANGIVHMIIGGIALGVAAGAGGAADQSGAMAALQQTVIGGLALWVVGLALVGLALHAFVVAVAESRRNRRDAFRAAGRGIGHAVVGATALVFALGGRIDGEQTTEDFSAAVLAGPVGPWLIGAAGLVIAGVGVAFVVRGVRRKFFEDVAPPRRFRRVVEVLGAPGFVAKGIAVLIVGVLFVFAAVRDDPQEAGGLDGALQSLTTVPGGVIALVAIAVGLIVYGVYLFARGIWAR